MSDISKLRESMKKAETHQRTIPYETPKRTYDEKLVAWFDVLGMRKKMRSSKDAEEIYILMSKLQNYVENACEALVVEERLNYLQIGDGFIIVADLDCINELCAILCEIQWRVLFYSNMLLRGALTAGKVSMSDDSKLIIGPAFIEAFEMESENAIYPRILFAHEIILFLEKDFLTFTYLKQDSDHFKYLDFLNYVIDTERIKTAELEHLLKTQGVKKLLSEEYKNNIVNRRDIAQKYGWLIEKLAELKIKVI